MEVWITAVSTIGFPIACALWYMLKTEKDKKAYDERLDKKDAENRSFTNKLVDDLREEIKEVKEDNKSKEKIIRDVVNTNRELADTNSKLHASVSNIGDSVMDIKNEMKEMNKDLAIIKDKIK